MAPCKFKSSWMQERDYNGAVVSSWAKECDTQNIFCKVCEKKINITRGICAIKQHSQGEKHKTCLRNKCGPNQLHLGILIPSISESANNNLSPLVLSIANKKQGAIRAELIWVLKMISQNYSFKSCDGIKNIFAEMFPDTKYLDNFSISPKKVGYLITEALGPHFKQKVIEDVGQEFFTLLYDETTNNSGEKELQFEIRYWSELDKKIVTHHLQTCYIQHATGEILLKKINETLDNAHLSRERLLMLGSDGPNVNKKVFRLMNEELKLTRGVGLMKMGTCNIHVIHNAFLKGLQKCGSQVSELLVELKYFFKDNPSRWADFENIQNKLKISNHRFIKHVSTRWLTIEPAAKRLLEQWEAVNEYFLKFVPQKCPYIQKTGRYKSIVQLMKIPNMKAIVLFVISSAGVFTKFTGMFQKNEPLVHLIYSEITLLVENIMTRICKTERINIMKNKTVNTEQLFELENLKPLEEITLSNELLLEIGKLKPIDKMQFLHDIRSHYIASCQYILTNIPILEKDSIIKHLRCISYFNIKSKKSIADITKIVNKLPFKVNLDELLDEWRLLQLELDTGNLVPQSTERIELFWNKIFEFKRPCGLHKFPNIKLVVKAVLSLSHGNADVERGFSRSGRLVTKERASLSERMVDSILSVSDILRTRFEDKVELVPITKELITLAKSAHSSFQGYLERREKEQAMKRKNELEEEENKRRTEELKKHQEDEKRKIEDLEIEVRNLAKQESYKKKASDKLLSEANSKLEDAMKCNDMVQVNIAQSLISAAQNLRVEELAFENKKSQIIRAIGKRKSDLLLKVSAKQIKKS